MSCIDGGMRPYHIRLVLEEDLSAKSSLPEQFVLKIDSKKVDDGKSKAKKGPKKKADSAAEFSQLMWIPCLSTRHNKEAVHVTASKVLSRLIAAKQYSHERTESDANYKQYLDTMIDQSGKLKKAATNGAEDGQEAGPVGEA